MTDSYIEVFDKNLVARKMRTDLDADGEHTPYHHVNSAPGVVASGSVSTATDVVYALGGVRNAVLEATVEDDGEYTQAKFDASGAQWVIHNGIVSVLWTGTPPVTTAQRTDALYSGTTALTPKFAAISVAGDSTNATVVAAVSSKKIRVINYTLTVGDVVTTVVWGSRISSTTTAITGVMRYGANGGAAVAEAPLGHFETASGAALVMTTTGTGSATTGSLVYVEV